MDDTTRLFLIRHGAVDDAWRGRIYGNLDVPLSPRGEAESRAAAQRLAGERLDAVVSSGLARAEHLAALLRQGRGLERRDDPRLQEIDRGAWRGRAPEAVDREEQGAWSRWNADPAAFGPPGGESLAELAARAVPALDELAAAFPGGTVAVAAHSWVLRAYACSVLDLPLRLSARLVLPTGAMLVVDAPARASDASTRPTLAGFALPAAPAQRGGWYRGPHRGR